MIFGAACLSSRDAAGITMSKFQQWSRLVDLRPSEVVGYATQTVQGYFKGDIRLWFCQISFLMVTDRPIDWEGSLRKVVQEWKSTEEYARKSELEYSLDKEEPTPPQSVQPRGPRTEDQDRFNVYNQNNRSAKMGAKGSFTYEEWVLLRQHFGNVCGRCKVALERPVIDHVIPLSRGGTNYIENIQTLCKNCNTGKGARSADYRDPELVLSFLEKLEELRLSS